MSKFFFYLLFLLTKISKRFRFELYKLFFRLKYMLRTETIESKRMLKIYMLHTRSKASKEDMKWANEQLKDILRTFGIGSLLILPFAPLTLPLLIKLAEKMGVKILPNSFTDDIDNNLR